MFSDSITDKIRDIRRDLSAQFGNDLDLILADIRQRETTDGRTYISLPPRVCAEDQDEQHDAREPSAPSVGNGKSTPPAP